jgi:hypothetical protein
VDEIRRVIDPFGREVVFDFESWLHLADGEHPAVLDHLDAVVAAIALPLHQANDPFAGRERFYARHPMLPARWLRVIVDYDEIPARVVTALVQDDDPRRTTR